MLASAQLPAALQLLLTTNLLVPGSSSALTQAFVFWLQSILKYRHPEGAAVRMDPLVTACRGGFRKAQNKARLLLTQQLPYTAVWLPYTSF